MPPRKDDLGTSENSILMTYHYPDLGCNTSSVSIFAVVLLAGKLVVVSRNLPCFLWLGHKEQRVVTKRTKRERELGNVKEFQRAANREMRNESDMTNFSLFTCGHQQTPLLRSLIYLL